MSSLVDRALRDKQSQEFPLRTRTTRELIPPLASRHCTVLAKLTKPYTRVVIAESDSFRFQLSIVPGELRTWRMGRTRHTRVSFNAVVASANSIPTFTSPRIRKLFSNPKTTAS